MHLQDDAAPRSSQLPGSNRPGLHRAPPVKNIVCGSLAIVTLVSAGDARAADQTAAWRTKPPAKAPPARVIPPSPWAGFYVGGQSGVSTGHSAWSATQPGGPDFVGSLDLFRPYDVFNGHGSHFAGLTGGYNFALRSGAIVGVEADVSFHGLFGANQSFASPIIGSANYDDTMMMFGTVRGRYGLDINHWLYYATGGLAWTYDQFTRTQFGAAFGAAPGTVESLFAGRVGWTIGAGVEVPIVPGWTMKA